MANYYPGSKNPYSDPNSQANMGKTVSGSDAKIDLSDPSLREAKDAVRNSNTRWCLYSYAKGTNNALTVVSTGEGEMSELFEELHPGKQMFAYLKVYLDGNLNSTPKFVYITWNPANVPPILKGTMHGRSYDVGKFLEPFHLQMDAQSENDISEQKVIDKLKKASSK